MGERFQIHVVGNGNFYNKKDEKVNKDYILSYHLQWCWGQYSVIRAYQILEFLNDYQHQSYNDLNENTAILNYGSDTIPKSNIDINKNIKFDKLEKILLANIEINRLIHSYIDSELMMKKYIEDLNYYDMFYNFDNNTGCLLIDTRTKGNLKYCFLTFDDPIYKDKLYEKIERGELIREEVPFSIDILNAYEYFKQGGECIFENAFNRAETEKDKIEAVALRKKFNSQLKFLKQFNVLTKEDIQSIFKYTEKDRFYINNTEV